MVRSSATPIHSMRPSRDDRMECGSTTGTTRSQRVESALTCRRHFGARRGRPWVWRPRRPWSFGSDVRCLQGGAMAADEAVSPDARASGTGVTSASPLPPSASPLPHLDGRCRAPRPRRPRIRPNRRCPTREQASPNRRRRTSNRRPRRSPPGYSTGRSAARRGRSCSAIRRVSPSPSASVPRIRRRRPSRRVMDRE